MSTWTCNITQLKHTILLKKPYYLRGSPKLLNSPKKWSQDRGEHEFGREGTYLNMMGKFSVLVWNNGKPQRNIFHAPECALPDMSIYQGKDGLTNFYSMFTEIFKE